MISIRRVRIKPVRGKSMKGLIFISGILILPVNLKLNAKRAVRKKKSIWNVGKKMVNGLNMSK
jgi:hypothetical protein